MSMLIEPAGASALRQQRGIINQWLNMMSTKVIEKAIIEDIHGAGPLFQCLAELLDQCSSRHNDCSVCHNRVECYSIWKEVVQKTIRAPLTMDDFIYYAGKFSRLSAEKLAHKAGQQGEKHTGHTPYKAKAQGAYKYNPDYHPAASKK